MDAAVSQDWLVNEAPSPLNFDKFLPWACRQFSIEADILITRGVTKQYVSTVMADRVRPKKIAKLKQPFPTSHTDSTDNVSLSSLPKDEHDMTNVVMIQSYYDNNENLIQIKLLNNHSIPRKVMILLGLVIPFHKYFNSIVINCGLHMDTIYEMSKFLSSSYITEICLDGTSLAEANYHLLLTKGNLKHLSLARCKIDDAVVKTIASTLEDPSTLSKTLSILNLSSNSITDVGAQYLADLLRRNRQLSYLNLADNIITDKGGIGILNTLQKFPITAEEFEESRERYMVYLKNKRLLINTLIKDLQEQDKKSTKKNNRPAASSLMKKKGLDKDQSLQLTQAGWQEMEEMYWRKRAESLIAKKTEGFIHPFSPKNTEKIDDVVYCLGNNSLSYLSLAYNNITYFTLKKLHEVLAAQQSLNRIPRGLISVRIEGNMMPAFCPEIQDIENIISSILAKVRKLSDSGSRKKITI